MTQRSLRALTIGALTLAGATALALMTPLSASADASLEVNTAEPGSSTYLTLRIPNESPTALTTRITVNVPIDTPFATVRFLPLAGWTGELVESELPQPVQIGNGTLTRAVTQVIFTADPGAGLPPGSFGQFTMFVNPVPDVGSVVLVTDQLYDDGTTASWNDPDPEAELPAPVLYVNDTPPGEGGDGAPPVAAAPPAVAPVDVLARVFGIAGLAVGAAGVAVAAIRRPRRRDAA